jgi:hypothetical protein
MAVDRAGTGERLAAPLWLAMVGLVLLIATTVSFIVFGMLGDSLRSAGAPDWVPVVFSALALLAAIVGLRFFCGHLYNREGDVRPGLTAHLRHCALLYAQLLLFAVAWTRCASAVCADDFGVVTVGSILLFCGIGADGWALFRYRRAARSSRQGGTSDVDGQHSLHH